MDKCIPGSFGFNDDAPFGKGLIGKGVKAGVNVVKQEILAVLTGLGGFKGFGSRNCYMCCAWFYPCVGVRDGGEKKSDQQTSKLRALRSYKDNVCL